MLAAKVVGAASAAMTSPVQQPFFAAKAAPTSFAASIKISKNKQFNLKDTASTTCLSPQTKVKSPVGPSVLRTVCRGGPAFERARMDSQRVHKTDVPTGLPTIPLE